MPFSKGKTGKSITALLLAAFVIGSCWMVIPRKSSDKLLVRSTELTRRVTQDGDVRLTEYCDLKGQLAFASDLGYAYMTLTKTDRGTIEEHFDETGTAIPFKARSYYAIYREYDENGDNVKTSYLDAEGRPVIDAYGIASIVRSFSEDGLTITERYLDENGEKVRSTAYGFARISRYDESGLLISQTYLDENDSPVITDQGFASISYTAYTDEGPVYGKVKDEFYFDEQGQPICLQLGQYGIHREYDECGRVIRMTYLDAKGQPSINTKGYATIVFTYQPDNAIASQTYYDDLGKPVSLSSGQYGISRENGEVIYLDADGREQFNIMRLLLNRPWLVIVAAMLAVILSVVISPKLNRIYIVLYCGIIALATLMYREGGAVQSNFHLLSSYKQLFTSPDARSNVLNNIWLFVPLGAILYRICPKIRILIIPVLLSAAIELIQLLTGMGMCELDDVISNALGGAVGYGMAMLLADVRRNVKAAGKREADGLS